MTYQLKGTAPLAVVVSDVQCCKNSLQMCVCWWASGINSLIGWLTLEAKYSWSVGRKGALVLVAVMRTLVKPVLWLARKCRGGRPIAAQASTQQWGSTFKRALVEIMSLNMKDPRTFFSSGTPAQFDYVYNLYEEALKLKAHQKNKKLPEFLKLDKW